MEYRKIDRKDIDQLVVLRKNQLMDEGLNPLCDIDQELYQYFSESLKEGTFFGWTALDKGEIVSTAGACIMKRPPSFTLPTGEYIYVTNVYTKNDIGFKVWQLN